ncbi:response regulator [Planktothrix sp. FACHB-1355]|uniref:histidine kinase n=1 Tax=Aerosakkonema funiforme FACHB-1375 TaxID=2949571 RepID=A0A926VKQ6_9CYAN|nr:MULTISPECIES: response regulator [Oscillatoriales]MBD2185702.1 response regulator [Aerosakkonema funiforme FACHB-1375]MBD3562232.1 response regulator [Planktothrix sp. FACHB-1355]
MNLNLESENKGNILIVDDILENLQLLSEALLKLGYTVRSVTSGRMALKTVRVKIPDAILLDIKMPEMDGYEVCKALKADDKLRHIPVIFISALYDVFDKVTAFDSGGVDYITKPFQIEEVVARLENQLIIKRQQRILEKEITIRRETEKVLDRSRALLAGILNSSLDGIAAMQAVRDPETGNIEDFRCLVVNPVIARAFNCNCEDAIGKLTLKQILSQVQPELFSHFVNIVETGEPSEGDFYYESGQSSWFHFIAVKLDDGFAITIRDITARKQAEFELQQQAQNLELTLSELKRTQAQLIQSEKMSSLGNLVAGVAHEINNPVNFIHGNLSPATEYFQDLLHLVKLYQQHFPDPPTEIKAQIEAINLDFLQEDVLKLLNSMRIGTDRIQEIVMSLRNFSRHDEAEFKRVDIHQGIDNTLMLLQNRLKATLEHPEIVTLKDYGQLPLIECYSGQLNQVFMNLLNNAIDSVSTQFIGNTPQIKIHTQVLNSERILIKISDNGWGIPEDLQSKLFDPFFTTKQVGQGTGLGLFICHQIVVDKHGGNLYCHSKLGKGAEFTVEIPINKT